MKSRPEHVSFKVKNVCIQSRVKNRFFFYAETWVSGIRFKGRQKSGRERRKNLVKAHAVFTLSMPNISENSDPAFPEKKIK